MRAGAKGYVLKDATPEELAQAVVAVARGELYLSQQVSGHVAADYARRVNGHSSDTANDTDPLEQLTPRQREARMCGSRPCRSSGPEATGKRQRAARNRRFSRSRTERPACQRVSIVARDSRANQYEL